MADNQSLDDQMIVVERALGERMINIAINVMHSWCAQQNLDAYTDRLNELANQYNTLTEAFLVMDDPRMFDALDKLTSKAYRLVDDIYADMRIRSGLSPDMHGFNEDNVSSVMCYFSKCLHFSHEDILWAARTIATDPDSSLALMVVAAIAQNLRDNFSEDLFIVLLGACALGDSLAADQALANLISLFAHYDVRIDFFNLIQEKFEQIVAEQQEHAFATLYALVRSSKMDLREMIDSGEIAMDNVPEALRDLMKLGEQSGAIDHIEAWMPKSENEYLAGLVAILPDTWVWSVIVGDDPERIQKMKSLYLTLGHMDLMWDDLPAAEAILVDLLRSGKGSAVDYMNYGHCCFSRGDRVMALENYRTAQQMLGKSKKEFMSLFRPDRAHLVDAGIPIEQVYLMEDMLCAK